MNTIYKYLAMDTYHLTASETVVRLLVAAVLGSLVGWERQRKEGAAGLRTHMLVCVGAALAMIVSAFGFEDVLRERTVVLDPSRIAAQVISGIGFLGAGTIIFLKPQLMVRGLTTAAGLWSVAGVGLAVGAGMYLAAAATTFIILLILAVVKLLEKRLFPNRRSRKITLNINAARISFKEIESIVKSNHLPVPEITLFPSGKENEYHLKLAFDEASDLELILQTIDQLKALEKK